jgi:hypothetical protein
MSNEMISVPRDYVLRLTPEAHSVLLGMVEHCLNVRACMGMDEGFKDFDTEEEHDFVKELRALLDAERCTSCDGSGDLIDLTGEWRGYCVCPAGVGLKARPAPDANATTLAKKYDDTLLPFLALMRKELHANAGKGDRPGWLSMTADTCMLEIIYHFGKLQASVKRGDGDGMAEYGADVANLCMMLLDICGVINLVRHAEQPAPVAVVMPGKRTNFDYRELGDDGYVAAKEWNACLDEVALLNAR